MKTWTTRIEIFDDDFCFIKLSDDLLEEIGWKYGDLVEWVDNNDGSYNLIKVDK